MKKIIMVLLAVSLFLVSACHKKETAPQPAAAPMPQLRLAADEGPNTNARAAVAISRLLSLHFDGLDTSTLSTAGSLASLDLMKQGKADLAIVQQDVAEAVFSGKALYEGKPYQDFRELCYLGSRTLYFLVPRLSTLSDIRELKDCKVAVGAPGSGMEVTVRALLRAAHMKRQDMVFQYLSDQEALSAVASGRVDAALVMGGLPDKEINEALAGGALRLIPLEGAAFEELAERTGLYLPTTIKLGTYPYMEGPVSTLSVPVLLVGTSSLPKERTLALRSLLQNGVGEIKKAMFPSFLFQIRHFLRPQEFRFLKVGRARRRRIRANLLNKEENG